MVSDPELLALAHRIALDYLDGVHDRHVGGGAAPGLQRELTGAGEDPATVLRDLAADADPGLVASAGPRYFGFVIGGSLPVAVAADWLVSAWDQMSFARASSPAVATVEEVAAAWALDILGLPPGASTGFVTGAQMANVTCLAAARDALLDRAGWDTAARGLCGAPAIEVLVGEEVHATVPAALRLLGLGEQRVTRVAADANGAMDPG
ncbi:MAG: pyridoxal-dependent decarboxylase, partial [Actinomycetota bacterium]|nr:pyridoxal-dependent decarboxylase [Actinomycetota bacterium]